MRKLLIIAGSLIALVGMATLAMAAEAVTAAAAPAGAMMDTFGIAMTAIGTTIGMAIAAAGCGIGQGMGLKAACEGVARNPDASGKITVTLILGLAFVESLAIYALVVNLILIFAKPFG